MQLHTSFIGFSSVLRKCKLGGVGFKHTQTSKGNIKVVIPFLDTGEKIK